MTRTVTFKPDGAAALARSEEDTPEDRRRNDLWYRRNISTEEDIELQHLLVNYRSELERMRRLSKEQREDLEWIEDNSPEERMEMLREKADWDRVMLSCGALARSANGTIGPGPRHSKMKDYEANKSDILSGRLWISSSSGRIYPSTGKDGTAPPPPMPQGRMTSREVSERKTWLFNLPLIGQRARIDAVRRLRDQGFELTEEQDIDLRYLRDLLQ